MCDRVNQNKSTGLPVLFISIEIKRFHRGHDHPADLIQLEMVNLLMFQRIDIHPVAYLINFGFGAVGVVFYIKLRVSIHRFLIHPHQHGFKMTAHLRQVIRMHQHVAARNVNFIFEHQADALRRESIVKIAIVGGNIFHTGCFPGGQYHHFIAFTHDTGSHFPGKTAVFQVGTDNKLHRKAKIFKIPVAAHMHGFQKFQHTFPVVPGHFVGDIHHIVSLERRQRNKGYIRHIQLSDKFFVVFHNLIKNILLVIH